MDQVRVSALYFFLLKKIASRLACSNRDPKQVKLRFFQLIMSHQIAGKKGGL